MDADEATRELRAGSVLRRPHAYDQPAFLKLTEEGVEMDKAISESERNRTVLDSLDLELEILHNSEDYEVVPEDEWPASACDGERAIVD